MKLTPKKVDKHHLKDWRPLTMMPMVYKLISKLLLNWFSPHSFGLINPQKTRFIPDRYILDNVSLAWVMHN